MSSIKIDETIFSMSRLMMTILWSSFLIAIISVGIVFSMVDPETLVIHGESIDLSNEVIYSIGFFVFWFLGALASGLTALLMCKSK